MRRSVAGATPATAPVVAARGSSTFAGKGGKFTLSLTNFHKEISGGVKSGDPGGYDIRRLIY
jgi:hypothetical protein